MGQICGKASEGLCNFMVRSGLNGGDRWMVSQDEGKILPSLSSTAPAPGEKSSRTPRNFAISSPVQQRRARTPQTERGRGPSRLARVFGNEGSDIWRPSTSPTGAAPSDLLSHANIWRPAHALFGREGLEGDVSPPLATRDPAEWQEQEGLPRDIQRDILGQLKRDVQLTVLSPWVSRQDAWTSPLSKRIFPSYQVKGIPDRSGTGASGERASADRKTPDKIPEKPAELAPIPDRKEPDRVLESSEKSQPEKKPVKSTTGASRLEDMPPLPVGRLEERECRSQSLQLECMAMQTESTEPESHNRASMSIPHVPGLPGSPHSGDEHANLEAEEEMEAEAEAEALDQTLSPYFVLMSAETDVTTAALNLARMDAQSNEVVVHVEGRKRKKSLIPQTDGHADALASFIPGTLRRCIRNNLVYFDQWKILLESPVKSMYNPVLSRFPAAVVFADASGFTKLTESLAKQPNGAEMIGDTINAFFGPVLDLVHKYGGDVIKFSGDALTIIWPAAEPAEQAHLQDGVEQPARRLSSAAHHGPVVSAQVCESCGNALMADSEFCRKCGRRVRVSTIRNVPPVNPPAPEEVPTPPEPHSSMPPPLPPTPTGVEPFAPVITGELPPCPPSPTGEQAQLLGLPNGPDADGVEKRRTLIIEGEQKAEKRQSVKSPRQKAKELDLLDASQAAVQAAGAFCIEVQEKIPSFGQTPVPGVSLTMHIGVGFGELALLQLGGLMGRWEYCVAGQALDQISIAEPLAKSGETCFSPEARELAGDLFNFEEVESPDDAPDGFALLMGFAMSRTRSSIGEESNEMRRRELPWWKVIEVASSELRLVKRYIPSAVALRLASSSEADSVTYPEEMRRVSVVFLSIAGLDPCAGPPEDDPNGFTGGREAQLLLRLMQRSVYALEGSVNKFLVDDKGVLLLVAFGLPPLIHFTDDPIRAVLCAMRLCDTLWDEDLVGRVGIATGNCWCGVVGTARRREYTVLGDVVNLSARLMGKAPVNSVLVDQTTRDTAHHVIEFGEAEEFVMKGKVRPVLAYQFLRCRKGLTQHRKDLRAPLLSWENWPARTQLLRALERHTYSSGVVLIHGPGGAGKTELTEQVHTWATSKGFTVLAGQNLDPSGTFALPRLCLQEAFRSLVQFASKDTYWRSQAWELLCASLSSGVGSRSQSRNTTRQRHTARVPGHAELYWMLIAMLRHGLGADAVRLEPWAPLMSLVVTQLAFGPRMVSAMMERNEQHARASRLAKLCTAVVDGFSQHGMETHGTVLLLHMRRSSAFFQSRDPQEFATIQALADLCMRRKAAAMGEPEPRPLVLVIVSREHVLKDPAITQRIREDSSLIEAEDLNLIQTGSYVEHLLCPDRTSHHRRASRRPSQRPSFVHRPSISPVSANSAIFDQVNDESPFTGISQGPANFSSTAPSPTSGMWTGGQASPDRRASTSGYTRRPSFAGASGGAASHRPDIRTTEMLSDFVHEVTGGNALGIETLFKEMERVEVLRRVKDDTGQLALSPLCKDSQTLRNMVPLPERLVGMAFSTFERLNPREQMVLKTASNLNREFTLRELEAALHEMMPADDIKAICKKLVDPYARTLRKLPKRRNKKKQEIQSEETFVFYSGLLRHAAHSLVLETQRTEVRRKTMKLSQDMSFMAKHIQGNLGDRMEGVAEDGESRDSESECTEESDDW